MSLLFRLVLSTCIRNVETWFLCSMRSSVWYLFACWCYSGVVSFFHLTDNCSIKPSALVSTSLSWKFTSGLFHWYVQQLWTCLVETSFEAEHVLCVFYNEVSCLCHVHFSTPTRYAVNHWDLQVQVILYPWWWLRSWISLKYTTSVVLSFLLITF